MKQLIRFQMRKFPLLSLGTTLATLIHTPAIANTFSSEPIYPTVLTYETIIPSSSSLTGFDSTDIYYPESANSEETFPIAVMLQGALVDKADYSSFASQVASYGFLVTVPNHVRTLSSDFPPGLFVTQEVVTDVLTFLSAENDNSASPIAGIIDDNNLGLLGHSFGGSVGLGAIQGDCFPVICAAEFTRPEALQAGIFYGTRFGDEDPSSPVPPIFNDNIPIGLIGGTLDGVIALDRSLATYEQIQDPPNAFVSVTGANHYGITNEDSFRDPIRPTLDQEIATETIARWSGLFLRAHLSEDSEAFNYVYNFGDALDENVTVTSTSVPESSATWNFLLLGTGITLGSIVKRRKKIKETLPTLPKYLT